MPIYTDPYDTGGGSTTSVCQISPSDNIAVLSNYGNRIADIERFLSRLVGADVHANNLSELADNMGNLLNGAVMMPYSPNDSWTGVGGSIAVPDGFTGTFTSGGVTTSWNNGVVTYTLNGPQGTMSAAAITASASLATAAITADTLNGIDIDDLLSSASVDYAFGRRLSSGGALTTGSRGITITSTSAGTKAISMDVQVASAGLYWAMAYTTDAGAGAAGDEFNSGILIQVNGSTFYGADIGGSVADPAGNTPGTGSCGGLLVLSASDTVTGKNNPTTAEIDFNIRFGFSIFRISG